MELRKLNVGKRLEIKYKQKSNLLLISKLPFYFAEKEGFEPPDLLQSIVFKTTAIDHSAISPKKRFRFQWCKYKNLLYTHKIIFVLFESNFLSVFNHLKASKNRKQS